MPCPGTVHIKKLKRFCCCPCVQRVSGRKCAEMKRMRTIGKELKVDLARPKMQPPTNRDCTQVHSILSLNLDVDAAAAQVPTLTEMVGPSLIHHLLPPWQGDNYRQFTLFVAGLIHAHPPRPHRLPVRLSNNHLLPHNRSSPYP